MLFAFAVSLVEGSYSNIIEIFTLDNMGHIQIHKDDYADRAKIYKTIREQRKIEDHLTNHGDVKSFAPRVFSPALAYAGNKTAISRVIGIDVEREATVTRIREKVSRGTYFDNRPSEEGYFKAMIGHGISAGLNLEIDDEIVLISSGADGSIANDIFTVEAIIGNRQSFDRMSVYLPLDRPRNFSVLDQTCTNIRFW